MTLRRMGGETITIRRAALVEERYSQRRDWSTPVEYTVPGVSMQAGADPALKSQFTEDTLGREYTSVTYHGFQPPGTEPVRAEDRILWRGVEYEVFGDPNDWYNPRGHLEYRDFMMIRRHG